jgi:tetratricopeptide (TPR) repeat protein
MFRRLLIWSLAAIAVGLVLSPATALAQLDTLLLRGQPVPKKGLVKEITKDKVTMETNGVAQSFDVNQIVRLNFDEEPIELNNARNAIAQRKYDLAAGELKKLDGKPQKNKNVAADIAFFKAYCQAKLALTAGGDKAAAITKMLDWARANANNFHFYESAEILGDLAVAAGQSADATRYYGTLSAAPWPDYQLKGNIAVGRALMAEKKFTEALEKFEAVVASSESSPEAAAQKRLATTGKAVCLAETGKSDEGIALLQAIIKDNNPEEDKVLFARTYNALGNCYLKQNKTKEALQAFLFTDILFDIDADAHAEALYHLSKLWADVNKTERATQAKATLKDRYGGSVWASMTGGS